MGGNDLIKPDDIQSRIHTIRGVQVMLDEDQALLYGVKTKVLNQAIKRNRERFPEEVIIHITDDEFNRLKSQIVTSNQIVLNVKKYNEQYPDIEIKVFKNSHDRFMIIDNSTVYRFGACLKDLGKKWFAFSKVDIGAVEMLTRLKEMRVDE
jgi:ORF6N domain.